VNELRYKAFISYSHGDRHWGAWLQRALESYRVPRRLVGSESVFGPIPARLAPVFRDREDLSSAADLSASVKQSLESSESLVVICSPTAAASEWVSEEISYFQGLGRHDRVFALIVEGDPQAEDPAQRCFPRALTVNPDGTPREPLAADARKWADGKLLAKLKLIAGILGIRLDELRRRDMQRRQRLWMLSTGAAIAISLVMTVLAVMAISARNAAENRREHAEELVGYMVGDLKSKLDEVGRLDILEGLGGRVGEYLQTLDSNELTDESLMQQARVWRQLGEVSMDQADLPGALEAFTTSRDILGELHRRNPNVAQFAYELGNAEFWVGYVQLETGKFDESEKAFNDYLAWSYRLNEIEPGNPKWLMEMSYAHSNLAALITRKGGGDVGSALVHIEKAGEFNRQVIELEPDNSNHLSEYGEIMAWLADTRLLTCDLGGALRARQDNVEIARQLMEATPGNTNFRSRYAFSLTGLSAVAAQIGLVEFATENLTSARDILAQLSLADPRNRDMRFEYLMREYFVADLLAEQRQLEEAINRLDAISQNFRDAMEEEAFSNQRRYATWIRFLLSRSDMAWRAGDRIAAAAHLSEAADHLDRLLDSEEARAVYRDVLVQSRFQSWQQQAGELSSDIRLAEWESDQEQSDGTCAGRASLVKQAILHDDMDSAREMTADLLGHGYYEPRFIRLCAQYRLCPGEVRHVEPGGFMN